VLEYVPGRDGFMLVQTKAEWRLLAPDGTLKGRALDLPTLMVDQRKIIADAFSSAPRPGGAMPWRWNGRPTLVADGAGNIWLCAKRLLVLTGDRWLDATDALKSAGKPLHSPVYLYPLGDGKLVYLTDFTLMSAHGGSVFAELRDGKLVFRDAPHSTAGELMKPPVRDHEGALWINGYDAVDTGGGDRMTGPLVWRASAEGAVSRHQNIGWARLCDRNGSVWLGPYGRDRQARIWREGKLAGSAAIPSCDREAAFFSDRPGSVFIFTRRGLHHMTADDPEKPATFTEKAVYAIEGVATYRPGLDCSPLGFVLARRFSARDGEPAGHYLHIVPLPSWPTASGATGRP